MAVENGVLVRTIVRTWTEVSKDGKTRRTIVSKAVSGPTQVVVPAARRGEILRMHHNDPLAAHAGSTSMLKAMVGRFYWYQMARDVRDYVSKCLICQSRKPSQPTRQGLLRPFDFTTAQPWDDICLDHAGPLPVTADGNAYILVIMDMFNRVVELVAVPDTSAVTTAQALLDNWVLRWGIPLRIHSDNGTAFANAIMEELAAKLRFRHTFIAPGHPASNPYAERFMKPMVDALYAYVDTFRQNDWDRYLRSIQFAYNTRVHSTLGVSPFFAATGKQPRLPTDILADLPKLSVQLSVDDSMPFAESVARIFDTSVSA